MISVSQHQSFLGSLPPNASAAITLAHALRNQPSVKWGKLLIFPGLGRCAAVRSPGTDYRVESGEI